MPTELEIHIVDRKVAELKAELAAEKAATPAGKIMPRYVDKLQLARSAVPSVLAMRPDYRAALEADQSHDDQFLLTGHDDGS